MKRIIALIMVCLLSCCAYAEEQIYHTAENRPYYHEKAGCDFGGFSLGSGWGEPEFRDLSLAEAEAEYLRPCPACAREWEAAFSGEFPDWQHEIAPWALGGGLENYLPFEIRQTWGDFSGRMYEEYGEGPFPEGYAGHFRNASGGITLMLAEPSEERMEIIRRYMGAEFWVLEADFDWNYLMELQEILTGMMGDEYGIHSLSISVDGNCVSVGVDDDDPEIREAICKAIEEKGYDRRAMMIMREAPAEWL